MIFDEYADYVERYKSEYGEKTIVLLECGSFYEIYNDGSGLVDMREIGDMLNIQVSRRNKQIMEVNRVNYELAGFPSHALQKFTNILLQNNYTVVLVSQVTPPPNPKRAVTSVLSPGTTIQPSSTWDSNELMVIYFEEHIDMKTGGHILCIGCSGVDVSTGYSYVFEVASKLNDVTYALDEVYRLMTIHRPREVYIMSAPLESISCDKLKDHLELERCYLHDHLGRLPLHLTKISVQQEILKKVWPLTGLLTPIEFISLEMKHAALVSFVKLVEFALQHDETLLNNLHPPVHEEEVNTLVLSYNCAQQLDIINDRKSGTILHCLNNCKTSVGKRYFKMRLLAPSTSPAIINECYHMTELCLHDDIYKNIREKLSCVYDLERLLRRVTMNIIHPHEVYHIYTSLCALMEADELYPHKDKIGGSIKDIIDYINSTFDVHKLPMYNRDMIDLGVFKTGLFAEVDELYALKQDKLKTLDHILNAMNTSTTGNEYFKMEYNEKEGYYMTITPKRWKEVIAAPKPPSMFGGQWKDFYVRNLTSTSKVSHKVLERASHDVVAVEKRATSLANDVFRKCIDKLHDVSQKVAAMLLKRLQEIDYVTTNAYNSAKYKLVRPTISAAEKSYVDIKELRHILIQVFNTKLEYVTNDVKLGVDEHDGMLLYGINSSGKSSLMKAVGIAVVMAQAGMYAPCASMTYAPYHKMFTRIFSCDDIQKGQSTFTREILELRNILKRASPQSLVIGDELCSGTENISALAIVSAGIHKLATDKVSFVFATHLHDLVNVPEVQNLANLKIFHLAVLYDSDKKKLVYDRKLKPGNGSTMYGIEVCKSLDLDQDFLNMANVIRQRSIGSMIPMKESSYNKDVIVHICSVCQKDKATEVHHIKPQAAAAADGYIGVHHKNAQHNLISLCEVCHNKVHHGELNINGYVQTTEGIELDMTLPCEKTFDIMDIYNTECSGMKYKKDIIAHIQKKTGASPYAIRKAIRSSAC